MKKKLLLSGLIFILASCSGESSSVSNEPDSGTLESSIQDSSSSTSESSSSESLTVDSTPDSSSPSTEITNLTKEEMDAFIAKIEEAEGHPKRNESSATVSISYLTSDPDDPLTIAYTDDFTMERYTHEGKEMTVQLETVSYEESSTYLYETYNYYDDTDFYRVIKEDGTVSSTESTPLGSVDLEKYLTVGYAYQAKNNLESIEYYLLNPNELYSSEITILEIPGEELSFSFTFTEYEEEDPTMISQTTEMSAVMTIEEGVITNAVETYSYALYAAGTKGMWMDTRSDMNFIQGGYDEYDGDFFTTI